MKKRKTNKSEENHGMSLGLGVATFAAAAAGAYFLYGSAKGPSRRKALRSWSVKMKGEVMEEIEKMKDLSEDVYTTAVDQIAEKYSQVKDVDPQELVALVKTLKSHWDDIKKEAEASVKKSTRKVKLAKGVMK